MIAPALDDSDARRGAYVQSSGFVIVAVLLLLSASARGQSADDRHPYDTISSPMSLGTPARHTAVRKKSEITFVDVHPDLPPAEMPPPEPAKGFLFWPEPAPLKGALTTDRPGFSDSVAVTPRGHIHFEGGYTFTYDDEDRATTVGYSKFGKKYINHTFPELALRIGMTNETELRLKWTGWSLTNTKTIGLSRYSERPIHAESHDDGGTDMSIGFKTRLLDQKGLIPNLAIIPAISLPTGSTSKTSGDVDPSVELAWNYALTDRWSVYGVGSIAALSDSEGRYCQTAGSVATFYQATSKLGFFIEYFGLYPNLRDTDCAHSVDGGTAILITDNFQIDWRIGMGLNEETPDFFTGMGFGLRW